MADFEIAVKELIDEEGGYVSDPDDPGGETKYGISKRAYPNLDIKSLTVAQTEQIYEREWWNKLYTQINSQAIATKLLSEGVNMGIGPAVQCLQSALSWAGHGVDPDGHFGPVTLAAVNAVPEAALLREFRAQLSLHYHNIVVSDPKRNKFILGWLRRAAK